MARFLTSNREAPRAEFSAVACLGAGRTSIPSQTEPLVDFSAVRKDPGESFATLIWLAGFAADGVAAVGVVSPDGRTHTTPVTNNIYADRSFASTPAMAMVALDKTDREIYRQEINLGR